MPRTVGYKQDSITQKDVEEAQALFEELTVGKDFRKSREKSWKQSERQYQGKMWDTQKEDDTADLININMSFSTANTIEPHLTGMEPEFSVVPFSADATPKNARIQEAFLNRMWRHKPVGAQFGLREAVHDFVIYGDGYLKTTWQIVKRVDGLDVEKTVAEMFVDRVSPWDVWIDPNSTGVDKARWVAIRVWTTEAEARADETLNIPASYEFTTIDPTEGDDDHGDKPFHATSVNRKWVVLYELYDVVEQKMYVVPKEGDHHPWKVVESITLPLEQIPGYTIPQSPYHMGEMEQIYDIQKEIDKTRSQQITHRKRNVAKIAYKKDALSPEALSALRSSVVMEGVPIEGDMPLDEIIKPVSLQPIPAESYQSLAQAQQDIYEITGVSEYQRGSAPDITRTATEAQIMQGSSNVKIDAKLNSVEHALRNIGIYMLGIAKDVYPDTDVDEMAMFVGGADGRAIAQMQAGEDIKTAKFNDDPEGAAAIAETADLFGEVAVTPGEEIFEGMYEVMVVHSSTDMLNPKVKADKYEKTIQMLMEVAPALAQNGIQVDISKVVRLWLEATGIPSIDAILASGPPPAPEAPAAPADPMAAMMGGAPPMPPMPPQGAPPPMDPAAMMQLLEGGQGGPPGPPIAEISPENSGSLDPNAYPNVGS